MAVPRKNGRWETVMEDWKLLQACTYLWGGPVVFMLLGDLQELYWRRRGRQS